MLFLSVLVTVMALCSTTATNGEKLQTVRQPADAGENDCIHPSQITGNEQEDVNICSEESDSLVIDKEQRTSEDESKRGSKSFFGMPMREGRDAEKKGVKTFFGMPMRQNRGTKTFFGMPIRPYRAPAQKRKSFFGIPQFSGRSYVDQEDDGTVRSERKSFFGMPDITGRSFNDVGDETVREERKTFFGMPLVAGRSYDEFDDDDDDIGDDGDDGEDTVREERKSFFGMPEIAGRAYDDTDEDIAVKEERKSFFGLPSVAGRAYKDDADGTVISERKSFFGLPSLEGRSTDNEDSDDRPDSEKRKAFFGIPSREGRGEDITIDERASKSFFGVPARISRSVDMEELYNYITHVDDNDVEKRKSFFGMPSVEGRGITDEEIQMQERKAFFGMPSKSGRSAYAIVDPNDRDRRSLFDDVDSSDDAHEANSIVKRENLAHLFSRGKVYAGMPLAAGARNYRHKPSKRSTMSGLPVLNHVQQRSASRRKYYPGKLTAFRRGRPSKTAAALSGKLFMGMPVPEF
ncbi:uncharacterized protein LOC100369028 [Saccoglossus kowalevskii]|uniref:Uncharacterized protein LOC100369028 n=1 Tax=Saccoglossus kowalevskii TaxID=10224 RepID=A0ABM0GP38_SACKO|nr:PREDICTED: uncharacterized protein LOC100369028 [Saccoglossus kowalevskii]